MTLSPRERNSRAMTALAGLILVGALGLVFIKGNVQAHMTDRFTDYILSDTDIEQLLEE